MQAVCAVGPADEDQCLLWVPWGECVNWWVGSNPCLPRRFSICIGAVNQVGSHTPSMFLLACPPNQTSQVTNDSSRKCHATANTRKNSIETNQWTTIITHRVLYNILLNQWAPIERSRANYPHRNFWSGRYQAIDSKRSATTRRPIHTNEHGAKAAKWQVSFTWIENKEGGECSCKLQLRSRW